jgi:hypothetical protein
MPGERAVAGESKPLRRVRVQPSGDFEKTLTSLIEIRIDSIFHIQVDGLFQGKNRDTFESLCLKCLPKAPATCKR